MIYSVFAGMGSTYLANNYHRYVDLESSDYQWIWDEDSGDVEGRKGTDNKVKNPEFPKNYVTEAIELSEEGNVVLISAQPEVLNLLKEYGADFITVAPGRDLRDEYIERYKNRGNNPKFIEFMKDNFHNFSDDLLNNPDAIACIEVKDPDAYLVDVI